MKLRKLRTTSEALPLSRCMSSTISFIYLYVRRSRSQQDLSGFGIVQDCSQRLFYLVRDTGSHLAGCGKAVDVRELHHSLPRLHLRGMTAMPLSIRRVM